MRVLLLIATFVIFSGTWGNAQSLGDLGRQERARQRDEKSRITITNESVIYSTPPSSLETDLKTGPVSLEEPPLTVQKSSVIRSLVIDEPAVLDVYPLKRLSLIAAEEPDVQPPVAPVRDEAWWRRALQEARDSLKRAEDQVVSLQVALNRARLDRLETTPTEDRARLAAEIARLTKDLESAQKAVVNFRRGISELEEDFRQSGGFR
jgi:hypothetical protein